MPMNKTLQEVLYWSEPIADAFYQTIGAPTLEDRLKATTASKFNNIFLWSLHVNQPIDDMKIVLGDLTWNSILLVSSKSGKPVFDPTNSFTKLAGRLKTLVAAKKKIFFSIGSEAPSDRAGDFETIRQLYSTSSGQKTLQDNFATLVDNLPDVTGFDFDIEDCFDVKSTVWLTKLLANDCKATITYCPFGPNAPGSRKPFWEPCLEAVYQDLKKQPVAWLNLQCYSGGSLQNPNDWAKDIKANQKKNGVADPEAFIVPGYAANNISKDGREDGPGICPDAFTRKLNPYRGKVGGAFVWNSQHIFDDPKPCQGKIATVQDYAGAIDAALQ